MITYNSFFSGIGGFDLGFDRAGMVCKQQIEYDVQCRKVLKRHWPDVNRGVTDVREAGRHNIANADVFCGGFPCQNLSVAGRRDGLVGGQSRLWFEFHRVIAEMEPEWIVIENVPGLLSSNTGRDFAIVLGGLTGIIPDVPAQGWGNAGLARGPIYSVAYRVLNAQFFGVAQRRRRVFIVASLGDGRAAEILFESESVPGDFAPGREEGTGIAGDVAACLNSGGNDGGFRTEPGEHLIAAHSTGAGWWNESDVAGTMRGSLGDAQYSQLVALPLNTRTQRHELRAETMVFQHQASSRQSMNPSELSPSLDKSKTPAVLQSNVRRLTPTECERLQGFPDGHTAGQSDSVRHRQLGNAVAVPVSTWIGRKIVALNKSRHKGGRKP